MIKQRQRIFSNLLRCLKDSKILSSRFEQGTRVNCSLYEKIGSPGKPFLYPGGRNAAGGVMGGAASQQGTTSGCIAYPGGSSRTFCCFSHRLRRRLPGANVFTAARKLTPLISSFWDFVFARYCATPDVSRRPEGKIVARGWRATEDPPARFP